MDIIVNANLRRPENVDENISEFTYHPDRAINAEMAADALAAERSDLAAGYAPRRWVCPCGRAHSRGHFGGIGIHRCLWCGYVGARGRMVAP